MTSTIQVLTAADLVVVMQVWIPVDIVLNDVTSALLLPVLTDLWILVVTAVLYVVIDQWTLVGMVGVVEHPYQRRTI